MADQNREELEYLLSLEGSVLLDIDPFRIDEETGAIVVPCADGRCFADIFMHHNRVQQSCREYPLVHPLPRHSGALVLAPLSPTVRLGSTMQEDLLFEIAEAMKMIGIRKVVLAGHYPCSKAAGCNVDARNIIELLFEAKRLVKARLKAFNPVVSCYFHIDFGQDFAQYGKKKKVLSYYASREAWEKKNK